ncbi:Homocitrate synthase 1 [[Clostridium] ultunense Esp]|nr:Homocitrate synthase 1 [[Clostridium] ultunense Esp]
MKIYFCDTTLRDGEQAAGVSFYPEERIALAKALDRAGVDLIEVGIPAMGEAEQENIAAILSLPMQAKRSTWNRARREDIDASLKCGAKIVHIALPVSDRMLRWKLGTDYRGAKLRLLEVIDYARGRGLEVSVGFEDASRAKPSFLRELAEAIEPFGVMRIRFADTVGILTPWDTELLIGHLRKSTSIPIEFHGHNDFGLAVANSLAAVRKGADWVSTTVLGLGERTGNAPMEVVALAVKRLLDFDVALRFDSFQPLAEMVATMSGRAIPEQAPVVGSHAFTHESGIHVDGLLKSSDMYESYPPDVVGRKRIFLYGKHSGRNGVRKVLENAGETPTPEAVELLLEEVRKFSRECKQSLEARQILDLYYREVRPKITFQTIGQTS